jgi:phosphoribosylglycinamide formyltransferase-1
MKNIAIFASGNGSNAEKIIRYFDKRADKCVTLVLSNNSKAKVLERAKSLGVETVTFSRSQFYDTIEILEILNQHKIDFIVLAGFLWLIPGYLLQNFPKKIINIHPALLPKYGGKGMYGAKVHESVIKNGDAESGITIHYVNEFYDDGQIIFQARCPVEPSETSDSLANKIHALEHKYFPVVVDQVLGEC